MAISLSNNPPNNDAYAASLTPSPNKVALPGNYVGDTFAFASQYLPDTQAKEFAKYGNRSVSGFLSRMGAEVPFSSDIIQWSEQGRLHIAATGMSVSANVITKDNHPFRAGQTVILTDGTNTDKGIVLAEGLTANEFEVAPYAGASLTVTGTAISGFVYGSEFRKGTNGMSGSLEAPKDIHSVTPIIIKDKYEVAGSDMAQIGWIEVEGAGYLWYLKSESETRKRFEDYLELSMVEGVPAAPGSAALTENYKGTEGLFYQVEQGGNIASGSIESKTDIDNIVKVLDQEGAIQENAMFVNRTKSFEIDAVLAGLNTYGTQGAASYGLFDNDENMALSLGFSGFNLGYDFYKTDWKYLNDATTGAIAGGVDGLIAPAGTTSVYDEVMGESATLPFLHVKYRRSATEDRKYKSWVVGSAGGASNSDLDAMQVHFLSERALCVMGANNFVLLK
jgi:hypothetical protein